MTAPSTTLHVLLVGIDAYRNKPLAGCVRDINAVEQRLRARIGDAPLQLRRLISPTPTLANLAAVMNDPPATLANLRAELADLATARVAPHDRVFIYYAGHGSRVEVVTPSGLRLFREALVPIDHAVSGSHQVLFDYELNERLRAIVARTRSVALVLDCCHSSGVTRTGAESFTPRCVALDGPLLPDPAAGDPDQHHALSDVEHCHVVAACWDHERAQEGRGEGGGIHGLFTRAFLDAIDAQPQIELHRLTWNWIWSEITAAVIERNRAQHPRMLGDPGRAVFGGPPIKRDAGIPVTEDGIDYQVRSGTLAGITPEARLAVYPDTVEDFAVIDSPAERADRIGVLRVTAATPASATAVAEGARFALPLDARVRLVSAGVAAKLPCAIAPHHPQLEALLAASDLLEIAPPRREPMARLEHCRGRWFLTDAMHGTSEGRPVLHAMAPHELDRARAVLEHYHRYWQPLRIAELATDLPGALELTVREVPPDRQLRAMDATETRFPTLSSRDGGTYLMTTRSRICFHVHNGSPHQLRVTLLNVAASGRVQLLGDDLVEAGATRSFWAGGTLGVPFHMQPPAGAIRCIDRVVAIGRTNPAHDLDHLRTETRFADVMVARRGPAEAADARIMYDGVPRDRSSAPSRPLERWTAAQAVMETRLD